VSAPVTRAGFVVVNAKGAPKPTTFSRSENEAKAVWAEETQQSWNYFWLGEGYAVLRATLAVTP
jgi:hypothetical protein